MKIFQKYNYCFDKKKSKMEKNQNKLSRAEQEKLDSFLTMKIEEAFNLFSKEKGYIDNEFILTKNFCYIYILLISDVPYVMQYLGQFPSIAQINTVVLPEVISLKTSKEIKNFFDGILE